MAKPDHVDRLRSGVRAWNAWRSSPEGARERPDLREADLTELELAGVRLDGADLREAELMGVALTGASLVEADLSAALLCGADLSGADLRGAMLRDADLSLAKLIATRLEGAVLTGACLWETQRAQWSIEGIECESAYWDDRCAEERAYGPGEFELAYGGEPVRVRDPESKRDVELAMLPVVLARLGRDPEARVGVRALDEPGATLELRVERRAGDEDPGELLARLDATRAELEELRAEHQSFVEKVVPLLDALGHTYKVPMTVLFLDLAGFSTMRAADQRECVEIARQHAVGLTRRYRPKYSNTWGDAIVAAFDDPNHGLTFACKLLQYLQIDHIAARVGMSFGELELHPDRVIGRVDIKGAAMSEGARLEPMARVGEVLISKALRQHPAIEPDRFEFEATRRALRKSVGELRAGDEIECFGVRLAAPPAAARARS